MRKRKRKAILIDRLSHSLALFYSEQSSQFLCPTCLRRVPLTQQNEISEAHIVPRSAGGKLVTLACRRCNSTFGGLQDKWFGEFIRLKSAKASLLQTRHQKGYFSIGDQRVGGEFKVTAQGNFEFYINTAKTDPNALREIDRQVATGRLTSVSVPLPLMENQKLIPVGAVTSAYLLWFRELGYSWALQGHLDIIREAILHPRTATLPKNCFLLSSKTFEHPWIGVGMIGPELVLVSALADYVVLFPPADRPDLYSRLPSDFSGLNIEYRSLRFYQNHEFDAPLGVVYHDRLIVCSDVLFTGPAGPRFWHFPRDGGPPRMMRPVSGEEFERTAALPDTRVISIRAP